MSNSPKPINSSNQSNTCGETIGSNCVPWQGGTWPCIPVCKGASITDVVTLIGDKVCGSTDSSPCYTGSWIGFSSSIPLSGTAPGGSGFVAVTWNIINFGCSLAFSTSVSTENAPQYKWTKDGNLSLRGTMNFQFQPFVGVNVFTIPMGVISTTCFPANFNQAQSHLVSVDLVGQDGFQLLTKGYVRIETNGTLNLLISIESSRGFFGSYVIGFGGVTFNLS